MKKEYIILLIIIVAVSAYLLLNKRDQSNYSLPEIGDVKAEEILNLTIHRPESSFFCEKTETGWVVSDNKYGADSQQIEKMVSSIAGLELTALVSEKGNLERYDLDQKNRIKVAAGADSNIHRMFYIGKTAPTRNHTFVKLDAGNEVYHAAGNLKQIFNKSVEDLRDKLVMKFDASKIERMTLEKNGKNKTVTRISTTDTEKSQWKTDDGSALKVDSVEKLLTAVSDYECTRFAREGETGALKKRETVLKLFMEGEEKSYEFTVFQKTAKEEYPALSSESEYPFILAEYKVERLVSDADQILGIAAAPKE